MITKDHSLKEIDVLKLIMYVLAFIFALVFFIALLIVPSIKEYKKLKIQNQASIVNLNKIEQIYKTHAGALNDFKIKNNKLLNAAIAPFDEKDFIEQAKKYFSEVELISIPNDDGASVYRLNTVSTIYSAQKLYEFMDFLNDYKNIIVLEFPAEVRVKKQNLESTINLQIFKSKLTN